MSKLFKILCLVFLTHLVIVSCAWKEFDRGNPDDYVKYWCDPSKLESSLAYMIKEESSRSLNVDEKLATMRCIDDYYRAKYNESLSQ